jgi:hypothetical protein
MSREQAAFDAIHRAHPRSRLFRNDNGVAHVGGKVKRAKSGERVLIGARPIAYGLQPGSGDLVGWTPVEITPEMVGSKLAVFTSIEAKTEGDTVKRDQRSWARRVRLSGGIAKILWYIGGKLTEDEID